MSLLNKPAPNFTLKNQNGQHVSLENIKGKYVHLYNYPNDMTHGCTKEACGFRDLHAELKELGVVILGVSADSVDRHKKFEEKERLNFDLLSDPEKKTISDYDVLKEKSMFGKKYMGIQRDSFLIDPNGVVVKHYKKVKAAEHPSKVLKDVQSLSE